MQSNNNTNTNSPFATAVPFAVVYVGTPKGGGKPYVAVSCPGDSIKWRNDLMAGNAQFHATLVEARNHAHQLAIDNGVDGRVYGLDQALARFQREQAKKDGTAPAIAPARRTGGKARRSKSKAPAIKVNVDKLIADLGF